MRKILLIALREYGENAKTKGFWIGILMLPAILFLSFQIPVFLETKGRPSRHFVLVDYSGRFEEAVAEHAERQHQREVIEALNAYAEAHAAPPVNSSDIPIERRFRDASRETVERFAASGGLENYLRELQPRLKADAPEFEPPRREFTRVELPFPKPADAEALADELRPWLRGEKQLKVNGEEVKLDAAIIIPAGIEEDVIRPGKPADAEAGVQYWSSNLADKSLQNLAEAAVNREVRRREYERLGLDPAVYREVEETRLPFIELNPKKEEGEERVSPAEVIAQWAPVGFVYLLWIAIFSISQMLLSNTIEEKSNRIIEVLLSSVTPGEFVMGKLFGIAAVGLTMVGAWVGSIIGILFWKTWGNSEVAGYISTVVSSSNLIPAFILYFLLGYLLYAALILAVGSVCNTLKEAQNYMAAITMVMVVPLMTMMFIPRDPNGTLATVLSWIPLYTPFVMMNRAAADPPLFDVIGTLVLLLFSAGAAFWAAAKIFRAGILRTGQPPRLIEMLRWIRQRD